MLSLNSPVASGNFLHFYEHPGTSLYTGDKRVLWTSHGVYKGLLSQCQARSKYLVVSLWLPVLDRDRDGQGLMTWDLGQQVSAGSVASATEN